MFVEERVADSSGKFELPPGVAVVFEPMEGYGFPVTVYPNGDESRTLTIENERPLRFGPWERLVCKAVAGDKFLVVMAEKAGEEIGSAVPPRRARRVTSRAWDAGQLFSLDDAYVLSTGITGADPLTDPYDFRRSNGFLLLLHYEGFTADTGVPAVTFMADILTGAQAEVVNDASWKTYSLSLANAPAAGAGFAMFQMAPGIADETSATVIRRGLWAPFVNARIQFTNTTTDQVAAVGAVRAEVWVLP